MVQNFDAGSRGGGRGGGRNFLVAESTVQMYYIVSQLLHIVKENLYRSTGLRISGFVLFCQFRDRNSDPDPTPTLLPCVENIEF